MFYSFRFLWAPNFPNGSVAVSNLLASCRPRKFNNTKGHVIDILRQGVHGQNLDEFTSKIFDFYVTTAVERINGNNLGTNDVPPAAFGEFSGNSVLAARTFRKRKRENPGTDT